MKQPLLTVNRSVRKLDGLSLATGRALFAGDFDLPGMLVCKLLESPHAHARITEIDTAAAEKIPGVVAVLTYKSLPRVPHTTAGCGQPETATSDTYVLDRKVRFVGDRVAAVAAETREAAERALRAIKVGYEILEPLLDAEQAAEEGAPKVHDEGDSARIADAGSNTACRTRFQVGDNFFEDADFIFDRTFTTHYGQHCPIEPHTAIGWLDEQDRLVLRTSTEAPFHVRRIVAQALRIPLKHVRVLAPRVGGGFGAKREALLEPIVGALVLKTRRPVKLELSRAEETISSRARHPMIIHLRSGLTKDGMITDFDLDVLSNTGAYGSHALAVAARTAKILPLYRARNVKFEASAVYTTLPVGGAHRGDGVTQGTFAMECLVDEMAERLGMDPLEFRRMNHIREGETSAALRATRESREGGPVTIESCALGKCIDLGAKEIGWTEKRGQPKPKGPFKRGLGVACLMQGSATPGADVAAATLKMNEDGSFNLLVGTADSGTGSDTALAQIAAEVLGVRETDVLVHSTDTDCAPFDSSSNVFVSGNAVKKAAEQCRKQILDVASKIAQSDASDSALRDGMVVLASGRRLTLAEIALAAQHGHEPAQIMSCASHTASSAAPSFAAHFAEVEVDEETGKVSVIKYVAAVDCGTPINPKLAEAQAEGAVVEGIAYALVEEILFDAKGRARNATFSHYKIFNAKDAPPIKTILVPAWEPSGPYGAKNVSEINANGPLPAIANAIYDAIGIRLRDAPFTAEKVLKAIQLRAKGKRVE